MKRHRNALLLLVVVLLAALPLWLVKAPIPADASQPSGIFTGTDDKARVLISQISPDYKPWFTPLLQPASSEIASLLFALQAALGAGFIGYYLGVSLNREKQQRIDQQKSGKQPDAD